MAKKAKSGVEVGVEAHEAPPQAAQVGAQALKRKRLGKAVGGASQAPGRTRKPKGPVGTGISSVRGDIATRFKKGESGNPYGRGKGVRNKLSEKFITALSEDFDQHGDVVIEAVRSEAPAEYLRIISSIVPKQFGIEEGSQDCFLQLWRAISDGTINNMPVS
jgi:Family of unknown function (DUF5681)